MQRGDEPGEVHPPGRRRLRSATRPGGYETFTIADEQYEVLRRFIVESLDELDSGRGVSLQELILTAEDRLGGLAIFPSGRFTNWIRFVKVDLECEGVLERVGRASPQRIRLVSPDRARE